MRAGFSEQSGFPTVSRVGAHKRKALVRTSIAIFLTAVSLTWAALAWASVPARGVPQNAAQVAAAKLYGALGSKAATSPASTVVRVIVHLKDQADLSRWPSDDRAGAINALKSVSARTQPQVISAAQAAGNVNVYERYWIFNGFAVEAPLSVVQQLAARDDVAYIIEDGSFTLPPEPANPAGGDDPTNNWNIYQVNAPQTWAIGYDGTGRTLANQDTGVDGTHQALSARWRGILPGHTPADSWLDPFGISPNFPTATGSHGTHTMGTIAGRYGDSSGPDEIGQAYGADWIACRIYDTTGKGPFSYMHACFQFMADPDGNPNTNDQPDAVGNSWGDTSSDSFPDLEWWSDIVAWRAVGIVPVFSNANSGPGAGTVNEPGSYPISIGVGAVDSNRTIAGFSSRGPAENLPPWNDPNNWERSDWNLVKPEVVAPGVNVRSSIPGNAYANFSGTSMASPHVTGLAGMLRQIRPDLSVNEFYNIIIDTAYWSPSWGTRPNNTYGWGEIDDYAAAIYVRDAGAVSGQIMDGACDTPVPGVDVRVYDNTAGSRAQGVGIRKLYSDNSGNYRTILSAGTYTLTVSAPGYYGMTFSTSVLSSTTTTLPIVLNKMPTGVVSGVVTDGTNPVSDALVSVYGLPNVQATTNASGQYTLQYVPDGTFTLQAEKCGYATASATIHVTYPNPLTQDLTLGPGTTVFTDDFESGNLNNWTVTGGSASTAIWNNSTVRAASGTHAARAGIPGQPTYNGASDTYMTAASIFDTWQADQVWLSFNLYDSAESEYDILRTQISADGGATWITVQGEASPVHGWQAICLDVTRWKSAVMMLRFYFHSDSSNWNNQVFEGPSIDDVRISTSTFAGTPIPAMTPTPGTPIPCAPVTDTPVPTNTPVPTDTPVTTSTPTAEATTGASATPQPSATPTSGTTPTPCVMTFTDVHSSDYFHDAVQYLYCHGVISGYSDNTFKPYNNTTRGQFSKIIVLAEKWPIDTHGGPHFSDVPPGSTFYDYIETAYNRGVISGYADGTFKWGNNITRYQICKIVVGAEGWAIDTHGGPHFTDVSPSDIFYGFVETAYNHGIISGYANHTFGGTNPATRGQLSKIVYLAVTQPQ